MDRQRETGGNTAETRGQADRRIRCRPSVRLSQTSGQWKPANQGPDFAIELRSSPRYCSSVRRSLLWTFILLWFALLGCAEAATGRVIKVLPQFLDLKGLHALSPSLFDRDAYQGYLRLHPLERSGIRFAVQWKTHGPAWDQLKVRVEFRGSAHGELPAVHVLEEVVQPAGWFSKWSSLKITGDEYTKLGELTAWRVTLWEGDQLLGEQKSFLW